MGIDWFSKTPVVSICKSSESKEVIKILEELVHLYGVPEKVKSDRGCAFTSKEYE